MKEAIINYSFYVCCVIYSTYWNVMVCEVWRNILLKGSLLWIFENTIFTPWIKRENKLHSHVFFPKCCYTVPKEIHFPRYNMKCSGENMTTQKSSCSIVEIWTTFRTVYYVHLWSSLFAQTSHISSHPNVQVAKKCNTYSTVQYTVRYTI